MKKYLLLASVAALAFTSCSDQSTEFVGDKVAQQAREITFAPIAKPTTRAAVDGTTFPTANAMQVVAYDVTNSRDFFTATEFTHDTGTIWHGGKFWPLSAAYINFLAYTGFNGNAADATDETTGATWDITSGTPSAKASGVVLVMDDNSGNQKDLMYAIGNGAVTQSANNLTFPANVPMVFKHAQAWISFYADAYDATSGGKVTLNSITLNGAKYDGTYTITHTAYNATTGQDVNGAWSSLGSAQNIAVPGWTAAAIAFDSSGNGVPVGDGLMIVPDDDNTTADFTSFTIAYTLDGNSYTYTYTPATAAAANVDQAKHYIYNINFHLHEILISATVTDWADQTATDVEIHS
jgi:hypothetical protein